VVAGRSRNQTARKPSRRIGQGYNLLGPLLTHRAAPSWKNGHRRGTRGTQAPLPPAQDAQPLGGRVPGIPSLLERPDPWYREARDPLQRILLQSPPTEGLDI
jgi:hypothetical protein